MVRNATKLLTSPEKEILIKQIIQFLQLKQVEAFFLKHLVASVEIKDLLVYWLSSMR